MPDPGAAGFDVVVYGHTHRPKIERREGVLYLNPGAAGPRRFDLPVTVAKLTVARGTGSGNSRIKAEIIELEVQT